MWQEPAPKWKLPLARVKLLGFIILSPVVALLDLLSWSWSRKE